jgi:hypothetical protein
MLKHIEHKDLPEFLHIPQAGAIFFGEYDRNNNLTTLWQCFEEMNEAYLIFDVNQNSPYFSVLSTNLYDALMNASRVDNQARIFVDSPYAIVQSSAHNTVFQQKIGGEMQINGQILIHNTKDLKKWLKGLKTARVDYALFAFSSLNNESVVKSQSYFEPTTPFDLSPDGATHTFAISSQNLYEVFLMAQKYTALENGYNYKAGMDYVHVFIDGGKPVFFCTDGCAYHEAPMPIYCDGASDTSFMIHVGAIEACVMAIKNGNHFDYSEILIHVFDDGRVLLETGYEKIRVMSVPRTPHSMLYGVRDIWARECPALSETNQVPADKYKKGDLCVLNNGALRMKREGDSLPTFLRNYIPDNLYRYSVAYNDKYKMLFIEQDGEKTVVMARVDY